MAAMIEVDGLHKHFGAIQAVNGISFSVDRGEVLGFLGPNGAGKSTTMKMIAGFLEPDAGSAHVCGFNVATDPIEAKRCIGYMPEGAPSYHEMNPLGFLQFIAGIRVKPGTSSRAPPIAHSWKRFSTNPLKPCRGAINAGSVWPRHCCMIPKS
jgi:ABC-2 type transport system ATP-binding protein